MAAPLRQGGLLFQQHGPSIDQARGPVERGRRLALTARLLMGEGEGKKDPEAGMSQGGSGPCTTSGRFNAEHGRSHSPVRSGNNSSTPARQGHDKEGEVEIKNGPLLSGPAITRQEQ